VRGEGEIYDDLLVWRLQIRIEPPAKNARPYNGCMHSHGNLSNAE